MPTYEYRCEDCGHEFEARQRMSDDPLSTCPECEGEVSRLMSGGLTPVMNGSRKGSGGGSSSCAGGSCGTCGSSCG